MRKYTLPALTALLVMFFASNAVAVNSGFYLGGTVGGATTKVSEDGAEFDENDTAWKIFGGYHFLQFFAVEAAYRNFGKPSGTVFEGTAFATQVEIEPTGFDVSALVGLPLGPLFLFGKISALSWDADVNVPGESGDSDDGTDVGAGIGVSLDVARIRLRGEIEYFDVKYGLLMYSDGGAWLFETFGTRATGPLRMFLRSGPFLFCCWHGADASPRGRHSRRVPARPVETPPALLAKISAD